MRHPWLLDSVACPSDRRARRMMNDWNTRAPAQAIEVLGANGVHADAWNILSSSNRLVVELRPCGLIAKIVPVVDYARLARELAVAAHIMTCNGPTAIPACQRPYRASSVAISLWKPLRLLGQPSESATCSAYLELRRSLDLFREALPDFREPIAEARRLTEKSVMRRLPGRDLALLRTTFSSTLSALSELRWTERTLHGDPHSGNVALSPDGPRWIDFESACAGPLEWDLSALKTRASGFAHDPALLTVLVSLRRACVVAWCSAKANPTSSDLDAIAHHLEVLRAEV